MSDEISLLDVVKERKGGVETEKRREVTIDRLDGIC